MDFNFRVFRPHAAHYWATFGVAGAMALVALFVGLRIGDATYPSAGYSSLAAGDYIVIGFGGLMVALMTLMVGGFFHNVGFTGFYGRADIGTQEEFKSSAKAAYGIALTEAEVGSLLTPVRASKVSGSYPETYVPPAGVHRFGIIERPSGETPRRIQLITHEGAFLLVDADSYESLSELPRLNSEPVLT